MIKLIRYVIGIPLIILAVQPIKLLFAEDPNDKTTTNPQKSESPGSSEKKISLHVLSTKCSKNSTGIDFIGEVKNISSASMDDLMAVVTFRDKKGAPVETTSPLLKKQPLPSGATSVFSAFSFKLDIESCDLHFKALGGEIVEHDGFSEPIKLEQAVNSTKAASTKEKMTPKKDKGDVAAYHAAYCKNKNARQKCKNRMCQQYWTELNIKLQKEYNQKTSSFPPVEAEDCK